MYDENELLNIMLEYYSLVNLYSNMDHVQERAAITICRKYNMVVVPMKEDGSEVVLAQIGSGKGISITIYEDIGMSLGIQTIPNKIWINGKRRTSVLIYLDFDSLIVYNINVRYFNFGFHRISV